MKTENTNPRVVIVHDLADDQSPALHYYQTVINRANANCALAHLTEVQDVNNFLSKNPDVKRVIIVIHNHFNHMVDLAKKIKPSKELIIFSAHLHQNHRRIIADAELEMQAIPIPLPTLTKVINLN